MIIFSVFDEKNIKILWEKAEKNIWEKKYFDPSIPGEVNEGEEIKTL